jgi:hypothetical protein
LGRVKQDLLQNRPTRSDGVRHVSQHRQAAEAQHRQAAEAQQVNLDQPEARDEVQIEQVNEGH